MDPLITTALIGAGSNLLGAGIDFFGGQSAIQNQKDRMQDAQVMGRADAAWSAAMVPTFQQQGIENAMAKYGGDSRFLYEVEGLKKAGIHPYLRYGSGGSATPQLQYNTAGGFAVPAAYNAYSGVANKISELGSSAASFAESFARIEKTQADIVKISADVEKIEADTSLTWAERKTEMQKAANEFERKYLIWAQANLSDQQAELVKATFKKIPAETALTWWRAAQAEAETKIMEANLPMAEATAKIFEGTNSEFLRFVLMYMQSGGRIPFLK